MLWGGSRLAAWLREGGRPERNATLTSRWRTAAFDASLALQNRLPPALPLAEPPIFILGPWRTGTTLLHGTLAAVPGFSAPSTWQCLHPASFRLIRPPRRPAEALRPMDGVPVTNDSAQEDEFALLLLGEPSLYRGFLDPRRLPELTGLLTAGGDLAWADALRRFLEGVAEQRPGRLVVKSPNHLFRLPSLLAAFPEAPIIVTVRDAKATRESNLKMWHAMTALHGLWSAPAGAIEAFVDTALAAAAEAIAAIPRLGRPFATCRFEDLVADPDAEAARIGIALGLARPGSPDYSV